MKRADLTVGHDYYLDGSQEWERPRFGVGKKATVLEAGFWSGGRYYPTAHRDKPRQVVTMDGVDYTIPTTVRRESNGRDGNQVLVLVGATVKAVSPSHLRGPWAETKAKVDAALAEQDRQRAERNARNKAEREAVETLLGRVSQVTGLESVGYMHGTGAVLLYPKALEALLAAADA